MSDAAGIAASVSIAIGVDHEHHRPTARHRLPTGRHSGAHAPRDRGVIELKTAARQPLQQPLGRWKFHQCFALGILLENGNRHSLPAFVVRQMRFALKVPIIRYAIDIYGAGIASGVRHVVGTSMLTVAKHRCWFMSKAQAMPALADRARSRRAKPRLTSAPCHRRLTEVWADSRTADPDWENGKADRHLPGESSGRSPSGGGMGLKT